MGADVSRNTMSEEHSAAEKEETERTASVNRRDFVKAFGTTGGAAVGLSLSSNASTAKAGTGGIEIRELSAAEKRKRVSSARKGRGFKQLKKEMRKRYSMHINNGEIEAVETKDQNGGTYQVVSFPLERRGPPENDQNYRAGIAVALRGDSYIGVKSSITTQKSSPDSVNNSGKALNGSENSENSTEIETVWHEVTDGGVNVEKESVTIEDTSEGIENMAVDRSSDENAVSTTGGSDCKACTLLGDAACALGCTGSAAYVCFVAGISGPWFAVSCGVLFGAFCFAVERIGGCSVQKATCRACINAGYCGFSQCGGPTY